MPSLIPPNLDPPDEEDQPLLEMPEPPKWILKDEKKVKLWLDYWDAVLLDLEESERQLRRNNRKR